MAILLWLFRPQIYIIFIFACWRRCSTKNVGLSHIANSTLELPCVHVQKATKTSCAFNQAGDKYFFRGGPCHYLFSKEEPPLQIHWSSGLIKLIATGPKPSAMLNLSPSTRALDELCNLVCLVKQETYLKSLSTFSPKSSRNPPWLLQYFLGDAKSNQIKFLVGFWTEWCYEETKIQLILDIHESTKA